MTSAKTKMKLCFVGNCQTTFLNNVIKHHDFPISQIDIPQAYRASASDKNAFVDIYDSADVIITRLMSGRVQEFVSTKWLRDNFGDKLVVIPNMYFNGFDPDLCRIYDNSYRIIQGPLGDYSCNMIHFSYINNWSIGQCINLIRRDDILNWYDDPLRKSLDTQRSREASCDIKMIDFVECNFTRRRLFYTFNHPTNDLLLELFHRLMSFLGISGSREWNFDGNFLRSNSLSYVVSPIHPAIQRRYKIEFECSGFEYQTIFLNNGSPSGEGRRRYMTIDEIVPVFFEIYRNSGLARSGNAN